MVGAPENVLVLLYDDLVRSRLPDSLKHVIKTITHSRERPDLSLDEPQLAKIFQDDIGTVSETIGRDLSGWLPG